MSDSATVVGRLRALAAIPLVAVGLGALAVIAAVYTTRLVADPGLVVLVAGGALLAVCYALLAEALSSKEVATVATLATLSAAGRVAFAAIPSVQPSTVLVIISGYVFGPGAGFLVGATTALVSNLFLGQGPWTVMQMGTWGLIGAAAGLLGRARPSLGTRGLAFFAAVCGLAFGWIMNLWFWVSFIYPRTPLTLLTTFASSLWFDILHAMGNIVFAVIVGPRAIAILAGFRSRFHVVYGEVAERGG